MSDNRKLEEKSKKLQKFILNLVPFFIVGVFVFISLMFAIFVIVTLLFIVGAI